MNSNLAALVRLLASAAVDDYIADAQREAHPSPEQQPPAPAPLRQGVPVRVNKKAPSHETQNL